MEPAHELDAPPIPPSQEQLGNIIDQVKTIYTNPSQAWTGYFLQSWKIHYNGQLGRYDTLTVSTPDHPLDSPEEKPVRITLGRDHNREELRFKLEQDAHGNLQIHQEGPRGNKGREIANRLLQLPTDNMQDAERVVDQTREELETKREWERGSGQSFVNSEEARDLLRILGGKKVPYDAKGIFMGQRFIGIR